MTRTGRELRLLSRPTDRLHANDLGVVEVVVPDPGPGQVLIRNTWLSIDPSVRLRLDREGRPGYLPPVQVGDALSGLAVGEVVASAVAGFDPGTLVSHAAGYRDLALVPAAGPTFAGAGGLERIDPAIGSPEAYLGVLGYPGLTAYVGLLDVAHLGAGDVVWVSSAAGAVGSIAAQLATLRGHRVIGSAGSPAKVRYLTEELGVDAAFDYSAEGIADALDDLAPDGIDVYFDNVGGEHLVAALGALRDFGRVAMCGAIGSYDGGGPAVPAEALFAVVAKRLQVRGFRVGDWTHRFAAARSELGDHLRAGRLRLDQHVVEGLERVPEALVDLLAGRVRGKTLCRLG